MALRLREGSSFFARNAGLGDKNKNLFLPIDLNVMNPRPLRKAWSSLTLAPVAKPNRNRVFIVRSESEGARKNLLVLRRDNTLSSDQLGSGLGCIGLRFQNALDSVENGGSDKFILNPKDKGSAREHLYELIVLG